MNIYRVRVYNETDKVIDSWLVELESNEPTPSGIMKEVEREYPGCDWSLTETDEAIN